MQRRTCILVNKNSLFNMLANNSRDYSTSAKPFNTITVFGSGYVGKNVAWKVAPLAEQVIIVSRSGDSLSKNDRPSNSEFVRCDVANPSTVSELVRSSQAVVNTVGIHYEAENSFVESFIEGSKNIAHAAQKYNTRLVKIATLGGDVDHDSRILYMDARGAEMTFAANPNATILKSSLMFGGNGSTLQKLVSLTKIPLAPIVQASGSFQPVFVEDVAKAVEKCLLDASTTGRTYELGGPKIYNFADLLRAISRNIGGSETKSFTKVPTAFYDFMLLINQFLPNPTFTRDHLPYVNTDMSVRTHIEEGEEKPFTFADLGIVPKSMEEVYNKQ